MQSLKTIIVDDDQSNLDLLNHFLISYCPYLSVCGQAVSIAEAKELIDTQKPDLIFLDIQLTDGSGFELLPCKTDVEFEVIFTTGFNSYAIEAIKNNAVDYLLKPIDIEELVGAATKAYNKIVKKKPVATPIKTAYSKEFISVPTSEAIRFLKPSEVIFLKSDGRYTNFHLSNNKNVLSTKSIGSFEKILNPEAFFRTHNQYIVNMNHIESIDKTSDQYCVMTGRLVVPISKRKQSVFNEFLKLN